MTNNSSWNIIELGRNGSNIPDLGRNGCNIPDSGRNGCNIPDLGRNDRNKPDLGQNGRNTSLQPQPGVYLNFVIALKIIVIALRFHKKNWNIMDLYDKRVEQKVKDLMPIIDLMPN